MSSWISSQWGIKSNSVQHEDPDDGISYVSHSPKQAPGHPPTCSRPAGLGYRGLDPCKPAKDKAKSHPLCKLREDCKGPIKILILCVQIVLYGLSLCKFFSDFFCLPQRHNEPSKSAH